MEGMMKSVSQQIEGFMMGTDEKMAFWAREATQCARVAEAHVHAARYRSYPMLVHTGYQMGVRMVPKSTRDEFMLFITRLEGAHEEAKKCLDFAEKAVEDAKRMVDWLATIQPQIEHVRWRMCAPPGPYKTTRI